MSNLVHTKVCQGILNLFDRPIIQNNLRGIYMEQVVSDLLGEEWNLVGSDWAAWDIEHKTNGTRIEVKQSAAKQTWAEDIGKKAKISFSIKSPKQIWSGTAPRPTNGRPAQIYIFAAHPLFDDRADHRMLDQWEFYVVAEADLPNQSSISLNPVRKIASNATAEDLRSIVCEIQGQIIDAKLMPKTPASELTNAA